MEASLSSAIISGNGVSGDGVFGGGVSGDGAMIAIGGLGAGPVAPKAAGEIARTQIRSDLMTSVESVSEGYSAAVET